MHRIFIIVAIFATLGCSGKRNISSESFGHIDLNFARYELRPDLLVVTKDNRIYKVISKSEDQQLHVVEQSINSGFGGAKTIVSHQLLINKYDRVEKLPLSKVAGVQVECYQEKFCEKDLVSVGELRHPVLCDYQSMNKDQLSKCSNVQEVLKVFSNGASVVDINGNNSNVTPKFQESKVADLFKKYEVREASLKNKASDR